MQRQQDLSATEQTAMCGDNKTSVWTGASSIGNFGAALGELRCSDRVDVATSRNFGVATTGSLV